MFDQGGLNAIYSGPQAEDATFDGVNAVRVFYDRAYRLDLGMAGADPRARGRKTEFPSAAACVGKTLVIQGTTFTIANWEEVDDGAEVEMPLSL